MIILLALAYHDRATFETNVASCGAASPSTTEFFFRLNMVGGSITLGLLTEATKRFTYSFGSALKLVADLDWEQAKPNHTHRKYSLLNS